MAQTSTYTKIILITQWHEKKKIKIETFITNANRNNNSRVKIRYLHLSFITCVLMVWKKNYFKM